MTQPANVTTVTPDTPTKPTLDDASAIAAAKSPAPVQKTVTVEPMPFDTPGQFSFRFYKADGAGATPNEWRCIVTGPGVNVDVALSAIGVAQPDAMLARLYLAAVSS